MPFEAKRRNPRSKFAEEAAAVGDVAAAERFREISKDEMKHRSMFQDTLASLSKKGSSTHSNTP
jgi:rubrerythrin